MKSLLFLLLLFLSSVTALSQVDKYRDIPEGWTSDTIYCSKVDTVYDYTFCWTEGKLIKCTDDGMVVIKRFGSDFGYCVILKLFAKNRCDEFIEIDKNKMLYSYEAE